MSSQISLELDDLLVRIKREMQKEATGKGDPLLDTAIEMVDHAIDIFELHLDDVAQRAEHAKILSERAKVQEESRLAMQAQMERRNEALEAGRAAHETLRVDTRRPADAIEFEPGG
jgi:hypothetical protein